MKLLKAAVAFTLGVVIERSLSGSPSGLEIAVALVASALVLVAAFTA